ncbi:MAG: DUF192 domain-containing protein [Candidatus Peregrinibacteria bacterium]
MFHFFRKRWQALHTGLVSAGVTAFVALTIGSNLFVLHPRDYRAAIRIKTVQTEHRLRVSLASTPDERAMGLMFVKKLSKNGGKLFIFDQPEVVSFWMKNTRIPLDMIFIGEDYKIKSIVHDVPPCPKGTEACTTYPSTEPVKYVLEVEAGYAEKHQIQVGDELLIGY